ncbi:hypothetical protein FE257_000054 [Aspergillus nanangensis]|uniref:Carrier domain-containing protein n=1 Tax=Aspergillus nanangensis TaxID=2582783 RepID=A0AAD4GZK1_ASPNN|nr:hypothetical protein FE257_000054 [Aspergillus nanangensis]
MSKTIANLLNAVADKFPSHVAVMSLAQADHIGLGGPEKAASGQVLTLTYSDLRMGSSKLAFNLHHRGIRRGSRVVVILYNQAEWAIIFWASLHLGCQFVPLAPDILSQPAVASYILQLLDAAAIFVSTSELAEQLEQSLATVGQLLPSNASVIIDTPDDARSASEWTSFGDLMTQNRGIELWNPCANVDPDDTVIILCTSGTTALPKLCPHSSTSIYTAAQICAPLNVSPSWTLCQQLPNCHIFAIMLTLSCWMGGGKLIYPNQNFNPEACLEVMRSNRNVVVPCVPSTIQALSLHLSSATTPLVHPPLAVILGGSSVTNDILESANGLQPEMIFIGYGATEATGTPWHRVNLDCTKGVEGAVPVGKVDPRSPVRVCEPGKREALPHGQIGELHQGGPGVIMGYIGIDADASSFYDADGIRWKPMGDQGYIDSEGHVYVLGRRDDLIIRGGENIPPLIIEQCLEKISTIYSAAVVGVPDPMAGQVPAAIIWQKSPGLIPKKKLQTRVIAELGHAYCPTIFLDLCGDLGQENFPLTTSGKVKRKVLRELVINYLQDSVISNGICQESTSKDLTAQIAECWAGVTGLKLEDIDPDTNVSTFTDSVMVIQFLHEAAKKHWRLTYADLATLKTVQAQSEFLSKQIATSALPERKITEPPPSNEGDFSNIQLTRQAANTKLQPLGLSWEDVEDIIPMTDCMGKYVRDSVRPNSWNIRSAWTARPGISARMLKATLRRWLECHPILRSAAAEVSEDMAVYLVMAASEQWLNHQIIDGGEVADTEAVMTYKLHDPEYDHVRTGGPLFKVTILSVQSPKLTAFVTHAHHSMLDALIFQRWIQHLSNLLANDPKLPPPTFHPFGDFVQDYQRYCSNSFTEQSVDYHVKLLEGISFTGSAYPVKLRIDSSTDSPCLIGKEKMKTFRSQIELPSLSLVRQRFGISAAIIAKCACVLVNVHRNGLGEAVFSDTHCGRFWCTADCDRSINPMEIDGPTMTQTYTRVQVSPNELTIHLLQRMQKQQEEINLHCPVPLSRVLRKLGDADQALLNSHRQTFNWHVTNATEPTTGPINMINYRSRGNIHLGWTPYLVDDKTMGLSMLFDQFHLLEDDVYEAVREFESAVEWLCEPENLGKPVSECMFQNSSL